MGWAKTLALVSGGKSALAHSQTLPTLRRLAISPHNKFTNSDKFCQYVPHGRSLLIVPHRSRGPSFRNIAKLKVLSVAGEKKSKDWVALHYPRIRHKFEAVLTRIIGNRALSDAPTGIPRVSEQNRNRAITDALKLWRRELENPSRHGPSVSQHLLERLLELDWTQHGA